MDHLFYRSADDTVRRVDYTTTLDLDRAIRASTNAVDRARLESIRDQKIAALPQPRRAVVRGVVYFRDLLRRSEKHSHVLDAKGQRAITDIRALLDVQASLEEEWRAQEKAKLPAPRRMKLKANARFN